MAGLCLWSCLLLVFVALTRGDQIFCPACQNPYDHETCSSAQKCDLGTDTLCQLVIHTSDKNKASYQCQHYETCLDLEGKGCHLDVDETCNFCCSEPVSCQIQRDDLFTYVLPVGGWNIPTAKPVKTEQPTTKPTKTTNPPTQATKPPTTASKPLTTLAPHTPAVTMTTVSPSHTGINCVQCGDFSTGKPCTELEVVMSQHKACPSDEPYCFTSFTKDGNFSQAYKGCATANFCRLEYEATSRTPECSNPNVTLSTHHSCGYCCNHDRCNSILIPEHSSIVSFP